MAPAARLACARGRGFVVASVLFHGTNKVSRAHDPERRG
jgi:hypothetical protein